jgi:signal transduction histidine kinase
VRWLRPSLPDLAGRTLLEGLELLCAESKAARGWVLLAVAPERHELLASLGTTSPVQLNMVGRVSLEQQTLEGNLLSGLSPFPEVVSARVYPLPEGMLFLETSHSAPPRLVERVHLALERISLDREVSFLRGRIDRLSQQLGNQPAIEESHESVVDSNHDSSEHESPESESPDRLEQAIHSAERRAGALGAWYRQAAGTLASSQLASALPNIAERAGRVLEVKVAVVLVNEGKRVRIWGGKEITENLDPTVPIARLGLFGRHLLEEGKPYLSTRMPKNALLARMGIKSLLAVPMNVDGHTLGALVFGDFEPRQFFPEEVELAHLMAYQTALFLENTLVAHRSDVERVVSRAVLASMADGVFTLDWERKITSFNPAAEAITGWSAEHAIGKTCEEVLHAQYLCPGNEQTPTRQLAPCRDQCPLLLMLSDQKLMDTGLTVEGNIITADGESRYVNSTYSVVADKGDLLGAVVLFRDITEKKAFEQMKSDYAAALSHDLKTPLTAMKGYAVTLLRHGMRLDEETRQDALEVINSEIDRVTRMFDNLLHQARMEAGQNTRFIESVNLQPAIKRVVSVHQLSSRRHTLSFSSPEHLMVRADRDQLDQILNNLVSNAVKYSPSGCKIHLTAHARGRFAEVFVEDTGPGIPEDQISFVFERFRRVQDRISRRVAGSGLGLYITRMLVEQMEGEVGVESKLGEGCRFWFRLPLMRPRLTNDH